MRDTGTDGASDQHKSVCKCVRVRVSVGQALSDTREINPSFMYLQCQEAERCFRDMALRQAPRATHSPSANVSLY